MTTDGIQLNLFGLFINDYKGLFQYPNLKAVDSTDWAEYNGIDVDLSNPVLDSKEFSIGFCGGRNSNFSGLIDLLSNGSYHEFNFVEFGFTKLLRLVSTENYAGIDIKNFALNFADDFPLLGYSYLVPSSTCSQQPYKLDAKFLSEYGVSILEGTIDEILKPASVKKNQTISLSQSSGVIYDGLNVKYQSRDVTFKCLMTAPNMSAYLRNSNALLYDLIRPSERQLTANGVVYPCHYKSSVISEFSSEGKVWCRFDLVLTFINN